LTRQANGQIKEKTAQTPRKAVETLTDKPDDPANFVHGLEQMLRTHPAQTPPPTLNATTTPSPTHPNRPTEETKQKAIEKTETKTDRRKKKLREGAKG